MQGRLSNQILKKKKMIFFKDFENSFWTMHFPQEKWSPKILIFEESLVRTATSLLPIEFEFFSASRILAPLPKLPLICINTSKILPIDFVPIPSKITN